MDTAPTLLHAFAALLEEHGDDVGIHTLDDTTRWTWAELAQQARRAAAALADLGVGPGDTVGLLLSNRPEFFVCDLAAVMLGATPVSIYATSAPEQIEYITRDAGLKAVITEEALVAAPRQADLGAAPLLVLEADFDATLQAAEPLRELHQATPDELLTIIYTSGTTGPPKGVELTHGAILAAVRSIGARNEIQTGDRVICWLPLAHIAERIASYYSAIVYALDVTTCPDPRRIADYLTAVHPTWFFAVPRIWEKLKGGLEARIAGVPDADREPAERSLAAAARRVDLLQQGQRVPADVQAAAEDAQPILAELRGAIGMDAIRCANVGAAPIAPEVVRFFHALGVPLAEIYGSSENCACATCNPPDRIKIGTVGPANPGIEVRIAEDGEVLTRGPVTMRGYRNRPDDTAEALDADGWYATGDIGELDDEGYLRIVDRKKELIINAGGKNMSPANIEAAIKTRSSLIGQVVAIGDRRPYNVALIVLDPDALAGRAADDPAIQQEIAAAVEQGNAKLTHVEQIKRFKILDDVWAPGGDELTPTMKLKRRPIAAKYAETIDDIYSR